MAEERRPEDVVVTIKATLTNPPTVEIPGRPVQLAVVLDQLMRRLYPDAAIIRAETQSREVPRERSERERT